jgi:hypothetical protein
MAMTLEKVMEYADEVAQCSSPENVSRFNQAAGQWLYVNLDAVAHLTQPAQAVEAAHIGKLREMVAYYGQSPQMFRDELAALKAVIEATSTTPDKEG